MKKALALVFLFALTICGQTTSTVSQTQPKLYQGEEYFPYLFDSYQARYKMETRVLGMDLNLLRISTDITENQDQWQEYFKIILATMGEIDVAVKITSDIDLKTGLLKKQLFEIGEDSGEAIFEADKIILTQSKENKSETFTFPLKEKIYPCFFSLAGTSYLPLDDKFAGSFACFMPDFENIKKSSLHLLTLKVTGSETVSTPRGTFDCYVVSGNAVPLRTLDGKGNAKKKDENMPKGFSAVWVDKKTRIVVKALGDGKWGKRAVVLEK